MPSEAGTLLCESCNKRFPTNEQKRHEKPYVCGTCTKGFPYISNLNIHKREVHERTHSGIKPFMCTLCGKSYTRQNNFRNHIVEHFGEKPFMCETCHERFWTQKVLTRHLAIVSKDSKFLCVCSHTYKRKCDIDKHVKLCIAATSQIEQQSQTSLHLYPMTDITDNTSQLLVEGGMPIDPILNPWWGSSIVQSVVGENGFAASEEFDLMF